MIDLNGIASAKIHIPQLIALPQEIFAGQNQMKGANKLSAKQIDQSIAISKKAFAYSNNKLNEDLFKKLCRNNFYGQLFKQFCISNAAGICVIYSYILQIIFMKQQ